MIFAKLGSDKNEVSLCLQSVLRFMCETLHNPSSTHCKCGLSYKACGPYLSEMSLIHWELDPGKNTCGSLFSSININKEIFFISNVNINKEMRNNK